MTEVYPHLFAPATLNGHRLRNRILMAPLTRQMAQGDGTPTDEMIGYYARRARGGVAMVIVEGTYFNEELGCRAALDQPGIATDKHVDAWRPLTKAVHDHGALCLLQLMHGGRVSDPRTLADGERLVSASDTQSPGWVLYTNTEDEKHLRGITGEWPKVTFPPARALTVAEIERIADGFAEGAERAVAAGFDGVEIHGANGYLLAQFIRPETNLRTDDYGGSLDNRVRFAKLVAERVRARIGPDKIVTMRLSQDGVDDFTGRWPGGVADARAIGAAFADCPVDALHWASFDYRDNRDPASDTPMSQALKASSGLPVIANGGIKDGAVAEQALVEGSADFVAIGRPLFAAPDWPFIVRSGQDYEWSAFDRKYVIFPPGDWRWNYLAPYSAPRWPVGPRPD